MRFPVYVCVRVRTRVCMYVRWCGEGSLRVRMCACVRMSACVCVCRRMNVCSPSVCRSGVSSDSGGGGACARTYVRACACVA